MGLAEWFAVAENRALLFRIVSAIATVMLILGMVLIAMILYGDGSLR